MEWIPECVFKAIVIAGLLFGVIVAAISVRWGVWLVGQQVDVRRTLHDLVHDRGAIEWVAIREPNAIYQQGQKVGDLDGVPVATPSEMVIFPEIFATAELNHAYPFEHKRDKYQIVTIKESMNQAFYGDGQIRQAVLKGVTCKKVK